MRNYLAVLLLALFVVSPVFASTPVLISDQVVETDYAKMREPIVKASDGTLWTAFESTDCTFMLWNSTDRSTWFNVANSTLTDCVGVSFAMEINSSDVLFMFSPATNGGGNLVLQTYDTKSLNHTISLISLSGIVDGNMPVDAVVNSTDSVYSFYIGDNDVYVGFFRIEKNMSIYNGTVPTINANLDYPLTGFSASVSSDNNIEITYTNNTDGVEYSTTIYSPLTNTWASSILTVGGLVCGNDKGRSYYDIYGNIHFVCSSGDADLYIEYARKNSTQSVFESNRTIAVFSGFVFYPIISQTQNNLSIFAFSYESVNDTYFVPEMDSIDNGTTWSNYVDITGDYFYSPMSRNAMFFNNGVANSTTKDLLLSNPLTGGTELYYFNTTPSGVSPAPTPPVTGLITGATAAVLSLVTVFMILAILYFVVKKMMTEAHTPKEMVNVFVISVLIIIFAIAMISVMAGIITSIT